MRMMGRLTAFPLAVGRKRREGEKDGEQIT